MEDEPKRKRMRISSHERGQELDEDEAMDEVDCSQVQLSPAPSQDVSRAARELTNDGVCTHTLAHVMILSYTEYY